MALEPKDIELIERIVYKAADDTAVSIARSCERLEERIDSAEARLYSRLADVEDRVAGAEQQIHDDVDQLRRALAD
jgi:hypothetical protein